ncbi:hypothetical protein [Ruegeria halocynthiae]|uniref:hypothetical protein n=1 Tax=Ruegeria halocynthiae TaxID=985054 RepID=UPI000AE34E42|nr:hypothetical protein [Ruegeria halocynthiae]
MQVDRIVGYRAQNVPLPRNIAEMKDFCLGCRGCDGPCRALIEALMTPAVILRKT